MRSGTVRSAFVGAGLFAAGWLAAHAVGGFSLSPPSALVGTAAAQSSGLPPLERSIHALMYGVATMAVDTEAAAQRIADLSGRHTALERRVAQLEAQIKR